MFILFLKGAILGLALAAPVGPVNLLCMKRSLEHGLRVGLITGLGAATADAVYGSIAAFGLTFITDWIETYKGILSITGSAFFLALGLYLIFAKKKTETARDVSGANAYFSTLLLTISNPTVVISFLMAFSAVKLNTHEGGEVKRIYAVFATLGVFTGSMLWWVVISSISAHFKKSLNERSIRRINVGAGVLLVIFAMIVCVRGVRDLASREHLPFGVSSTP